MSMSFVSATLPSRCLSHAPLFPPLPPEHKGLPFSRAVVVHCPTRLRRPRTGHPGMAFSDGGSVSVGHGPGSAGNEGTSDDRGTSSPGSNLTDTDKPVVHPDVPHKRSDKDGKGQQPLLNDKPQQ